MNRLFMLFSACVTNVEMRMVIETNEKDGVGDNIYWLVDVNDLNNSNTEFYGSNGSVVCVSKCFTDGVDNEFYEYATYEEGWLKVKELAEKATKTYIEGY